MTEEIKKTEARAGETSKNHNVLKVLIGGLVLAAVAWFVLELIYV